MSRTRGAAVTKTDNEKYVKRGAGLIMEYDPEWKDDVRRANEGKVCAPYQYADMLIMMAAGIRVAPGVPYRQLQLMLGKMLRGYDTPVFSQTCERINKLDTYIRRGPNGFVTVSDRERSLCRRSTQAGSSSTVGENESGPSGRRDEAL